MKVTGTPTIVFAGKKYAAKGSPETKDNVTTYTFEGLSKETRFTAAQACPLLS